jgi:predicted RNA-binding Zn-ribbon protein involved in translation (DUF1610 family)
MDRARKCWKCNNSAQISEMRYDKTGKDLICANCLIADRGHSQEQKSEASTSTKKEYPASNPRPIIKPSVETSKSDKSNYQCGSCGFGFTREKSAIVNACPYCGKNNVRNAFKNSAQNLIEESQRENFDN